MRGNRYKCRASARGPIPLDADTVTVPLVKPVEWASVLLSTAAAAVSLAVMVGTGGLSPSSALVYCACAAACLVEICIMAALRVTIDSTGFHVRSLLGRRTVPWPASRTGLFPVLLNVRRRLPMAMVCVVAPDGRWIRMRSLAWYRLSRDEAVSLAVLHCWRIWNWGAAKGYTRETGAYTPLRNPRVQHERSQIEWAFGILPTTGAPRGRWTA